MSRDKQTGFHISKESVDKLFPKKDIDILGYESPIQVFIGQMRIDHERTLESETLKAVRAIDVTVDKEELIKALQYDRNQYEKGYINGYNAKASEVAREVIDDCITILNTEYRKCDTNDVKIILAMVRALAELKKKYIGKDTNVTTNTEEEK